VSVGEPGCDESFVAKTDDEAQLRAWLVPGRLGVLVRTAAAYPGLTVTEGELRYQRNGLESSRDTLISTVRRLVDAADAVSKTHAADSARAIVDARARGEWAAVATRLRDLANKRAASLDEALLEVDTLATAGDRQAAAHSHPGTGTAS
jgi:hypothetical protein